MDPQTRAREALAIRTRWYQETTDPRTHQLVIDQAYKDLYQAFRTYHPGLRNIVSRRRFYELLRGPIGTTRTPESTTVATQDFLDYISPPAAREAAAEWIASDRYHHTPTKTSLYYRLVVYYASAITRYENKQAGHPSPTAEQGAGPSTQPETDILFEGPSQYVDALSHQGRESDEDSTGYQSDDSQQGTAGLGIYQGTTGQEDQTPEPTQPPIQRIGLPSLTGLFDLISGNQVTPSHTAPQPHQAEQSSGESTPTGPPPIVNTMVDANITALTTQLAALAGIVGQIAEQNKPTKTLRIPTFSGKNSDIENFINAVDTGYRANQWNDNRVPIGMLTNNQNSTLQQLFATSAAQVETVATFFTGTAAEFWRTLEQHPVTWEARPQVNGQVSGNNRPGWDDHEAGPGLKALLLTKFQNAAYIQETWNKLSQMKFYKNGEEDLETFATRMDAYLKTVGLTYQENNLAINGTRANHLFAALPDWLTQKIKEQGLPQGCPHYSWCFAQVQRRAREILAAQAPRNQEHKMDNQDRRNSTRRNDQKNDQRYDQRHDQRNQ